MWLFFGWGGPGYNAQDLSTVRMVWGAVTPTLVARTHLGLPDANAAGNFRLGLTLVDGHSPWSALDRREHP